MREKLPTDTPAEPPASRPRRPQHDSGFNRLGEKFRIVIPWQESYNRGITTLSDERDEDMRFCELIEASTQKKEYDDHVEAIVRWYQENVKKYAAMLRTELGLTTMNDDLMESRQWAKKQGLGYNFDAKQTYFNVADALTKLILSCYSAGPSQEFYNTHGIDMENIRRLPIRSDLKKSWITCKDNALQLTEVLAKVLRDEKVDFDFDLQALQRDRSDRAPLTHSALITACLSAIRCYRSIRSMLLFLAPERKDELPVLEYSGGPAFDGARFDYDEFLAEPCSLSFDDDTTILLVDSVHDVPDEQRRLVANLPWDLVVDLDGYSDCGGLLSCVEHNRLQRDVLTRSIAMGPQILVKNTTLWYRCGEYQLCTGNPTPQLSIPAYTWFCCDRDPLPQRLRMWEKMQTVQCIFENLLKKADHKERRVNIVALTDDKSLAQALHMALDNASPAEYFLTWVGLSDKDADSCCSDWFYGYREDMDECFRRINCPTALFFETLTEYRRDLPLRVSVETSFTLPAGGRRVHVSENDRNNLAPFFDVLYDGCENDGSSWGQTEAFYQGNTAAWSTIANDDAIPLERETKRTTIINRIKTLLGVTQEDPQKRLFFIQHTPGLGGTTFARQLAWELHREYAVLSVSLYDSSIGLLVENLYDNVLKKEPVVLLAEDTLPNLKALCDSVCNLRRRCILLVAVRSNNSLLTDYRHAEKLDMIRLTDATVDKLRSRFRDMSLLDPTLIWQRNQDFERVITTSMRTPFIIGLYYMEENFNINNYVRKALAGCVKRDYADVIGCLALCDEFYCKNFPVSLVSSWLGLTVRNEFLRLLPAASSIMVKERSDSGIDVYHFKHPLLSRKFLELYCCDYYNGAENRSNAIYDLTWKLIDRVANMGRNLREDSLNLLISLMIQNKSGREGDGFLSLLMNAIGMTAYQRNLMLHLAETFRPMADEIRSRKNLELDTDLTSLERIQLRLVSHAYAHLGKLYSQGEKNFAKAGEMMSLATDYMPDMDPLIYHMHGKSLLDEMKEQWKAHQDSTVTAEEFAAWDSKVSMARESFYKACEYGSPEYGLPSLLDLYETYLEFIYRVRGIHSSDELNLLSPEQHQLHTNFLSALEDAHSYNDLGEVAESHIQDIENRFRSQIMFGNFSKAVEYYQNQVDCLKDGHDVDGYNRALRGLVFARISAAKAQDSGGLFCAGIESDQKKQHLLFHEINELLQRPYDPSSYADYFNYTRIYHYWMLLAKQVGTRLDEGLSKARQWLEMEERSKRPHNPEPYYYVKVLEYLNWKDGSGLAPENVRNMDALISRLDSDHRFDRRRGSLDKMRDLFVVGKEMGQLLDVTGCHSEEDILNVLDDSRLQPQIFEGHLDECVYQYGVLRLYQPGYWANEKAWLDTGKRVGNTLSLRQLNHNIIFMGGFAVDRLRALPNSARDKSSDEHFNVSDILKSARKNQTHSQAKPTTAAPSRPATASAEKRLSVSPMGVVTKLGMKATFLPQNAQSNRRGEWYVNGTVAGKDASLSCSRDLAGYGDKALHYFGGVEAIACSLAEKDELPCLIIREDLDKYMVSIYSTGCSLEELLPERVEAAKKASPAPEMVEETPVKAGEAVDMTITVVSDGVAEGEFEKEGVHYRARIGKLGGKKRERIEKAHKTNTKLKVRIQGGPKNGVYQVMVV